MKFLSTQSEISFIDQTISERHDQLEKTIGALEMEKDSLDTAYLFSFAFYPTWIMLSIIQVLCYVLSNGRFNNLSKVIEACNDRNQGTNLALHIQNHNSNLFQ